MATGWLGWPPDIAWEAPISQILLAVEGRVDFAIKTNPFGGGESKKKSTKDELEEQRKAELKAKNQALALKFDMMSFNARHKHMGLNSG